MAIKSLNSVGGFSVKDSVTGDPIVIIDSNGNINTPTLTVTGNTNLGNLGNVTITGGTANYVLQTDGTGNLTWVAQSGGSGNTSITSPMPTVINSGETYYVTANHQGLFGVPIEINGALQVDGVLVDTNTGAGGNSTQLLYKNGAQIQGVPIATYDGSNLSLGSTSTLKITGGTNGYVLQTDGTGNLTWTAQTGGGSGGVSGANTQVQFNDAGAFGGNSSFTFDKTTGLLTAPYLSGNGSNLNSITGGNVTGAVPFATIANSVAGGNVSGQVSNSLISGTVFANAQPNITSTGILSSVSVSGNANIGNIGTGGLITVTGNLNAGNLITTGVISATGNANIGNIGTSGLITSTGNITGGNLITAGVVSATGNANVGNIGTGGLITATGNIRGANLITSGVLSVTGNANVGNLSIPNGNTIVTYAPATATGYGITISAANTQGGTGYADFLKVTNTSGGATNPNKSFRLSSAGAVEIINSAYNATILSLSDTGGLSVPGPISINGKQAVNGPAFSAYANATLQTITSGSQQKVLFQTEEFDTNSNFASSRFTPTVEGYYQLNAEVRLDGASGTGEMMIVLYKNGSEYKRGTNQSGTQIASSFWAMQVSSVVYANGTGDYFEIYVQQGSGGSVTVTAVNNPAITWFNGCMLRGG